MKGFTLERKLLPAISVTRNRTTNWRVENDAFSYSKTLKNTKSICMDILHRVQIPSLGLKKSTLGFELTMALVLW